MTDFVQILEDHCTTLGWVFSYGNRANRNLFVSNTVHDEVYLFLDPVVRSNPGSENGGIGETVFTGSFFVAVKANLDQQYHNQKDRPKASGKYESNILPLLEDITGLEKIIDCSDLERTTWTVTDAVNALDANMDGVVVDYSVKTL